VTSILTNSPAPAGHHVRGSLAARTAYGALFVVLLPALLVLWARRLDALIHLPVYGSPVAGLTVAIAGLAIMAAGTSALWTHGHGLPMSPFPPERLVTRGIYHFIADPLYVGAVVVSAGVSLATRSAAGLWIVTPVLALAVTAWVVGFERDLTRERYGALVAPVVRLTGVMRVVLAPVLVLWRPVRRGAEVIANSWSEMTVGRVRLINHGIYAATGVAVTMLIAAWLAGPRYVWWIAAAGAAGTLGAALWAQGIEGSPQLLRPFGYFGAMAGVLAVAVIAWVVGAGALRLTAAIVVGGTFGQALGRFRCLVQGCCHGRPTTPSIGIVYRHRRTRVVRLTEFGGVPIHPTQVYSMACTTVTGAGLLVLWTLGAPLQLIAGLYFILAGLGRFVEEHFRGEPQTPAYAGFRLYQWLALAFVMGGAVLTTVGATPAPSPGLLDLRAPAIAIVAFLLSYASFGMDFPRSSRRFSRLV
jgi:phosphatidylglycerol:prolipoprotein diacylglycerol transferase